MDLGHRTESTEPTAPSSWVLEINVQPPEVAAPGPAGITYSVDCISLSLPFAVQDRLVTRKKI